MSGVGTRLAAGKAVGGLDCKGGWFSLLLVVERWYMAVELALL
jgi:hypothetical protein